MYIFFNKNTLFSSVLTDVSLLFKYVCVCVRVDHVLNRIQLLMMPCYGNNIVVNFLLELFYTHFVYFIIQAYTHAHTHKIQHRDDEDDDFQLNF